MNFCPNNVSERLARVLEQLYLNKTVTRLFWVQASHITPIISIPDLNISFMYRNYLRKNTLHIFTAQCFTQCASLSGT